MLVTVAICTWNRAKLLDQTLAEMQKLVIPDGVEWELLVVNNNSTDETDEVISRYANTLPIVRLFEPKAGKSYAANLALEHVSGELLVWTDDDVLVSPEWLSAYASAARRWPAASFFAGAIEPWFENEPPCWVKRNIRRLRCVYVIADLGDVERGIAPEDGVYGANLAFRANVAKQYPLNPSLGRIRDELIGADDTDVVRRVTSAGMHGVVVPSARVRHFVPASRLNRRYVWNWFRGAGRNLVLCGGISASKTVFGVPRWAARKYIEKQLLAWSLSPFGNAAWFDAFVTAARLRGVMQQVRLSKVGIFAAVERPEQS